MIRIETISDLEFEFFDSDGVDPLISYLGGIASKSIPSIKEGHRVTANIATHPPRFEKLLRTLESIEDQFDEVRIYLNNYVSVPDELLKYNTYLGTDLTDNAKFLWSSEPGQYYFTIDDDILYPPDYVSRTLPLIGDRVISYHGRRLFGKGQRYYDNHRLYSYFSGLSKEVLLDVAGTGVMAFDTDVFRPSLWRTPNYRMTDLVISLETHMYGLDLVCLPRESMWIDMVGDDFDGIYWEERNSDVVQRRFADMILSYRGSVCNTSILNENFDSESLSLLSSSVSNISPDRVLVLRFGNGHIVDSLSVESNVVAIETERVRVDLCSSKDSVRYEYVREYRKVKYEKDDVVILDDRFLPNRISGEVHSVLPIGCNFFCTRLVNGVFPVGKIEMFTDTRKSLFFYKYIIDSDS